MTAQQLDSIKRYTQNDDQPLADSLRSYGLPSNTKQLSDYINLWRYILKHPVNKNITVYRGVRVTDGFPLYDFEGTFDVFSKSFISTSASEGIGINFLRGYTTCCVQCINLPSNARATYIGGGEDEVLLAPGIIKKIGEPYQKRLVYDAQVRVITYYDCEYKNDFDEAVFKLYNDVISIKTCEECNENPSTFYCVDCNQQYCCHLEKHLHHRHYDKNLVLSNTPSVSPDYKRPEMEEPITKHLNSIRVIKSKPKIVNDEDYDMSDMSDISYQFKARKKSNVKKSKKKTKLKKKSKKRSLKHKK